MNRLHFYSRRKSEQAPKLSKEIKEENNKNLNKYNRKSVPLFSSLNNINQKNMNQTDNKKEKNEERTDKYANKKKEVNIDNKVNKIEKQNKNEYKIMDDLFNEVEKFNAKNILKGDLADIYKEVIKENEDFKENIFFVNLNHYENMVGNCDKKIISHTFKDLKREELFQKKYLPAKELYNKYSDKAKIIKENNENEF